MPGEPQLGSNPFIGIDCGPVTITDLDAVPSSSVLNHGSPFRLSATFTLGGSFALFIVGLGVSYTATYYVSQIGGPVNMTLGVATHPTVAGKLVYSGADTEIQVPAGGLAAGVYELAVTISFGGAPPMVAFNTGPVVEVF